MNGCEGFGREEKGIEEGKSYLRTDLGVDEDRIIAAIASLSRKAGRSKVTWVR